jgi:hypothetical protein
MKKIIYLFALVMLVSGCANPGIIRLSSDTYMISREDHGGIFGNAANMKANVIRDANRFAAKQEKAVIPISTKERPMRSWQPAGWATIEYQFKVVDKDDSRLKEDNKEVEMQPGEDLTAKLKTLNKLLADGLITQKEFAESKQRLLDNYSAKK